MPRMPEVRRQLRESYQVAYAKSGMVLYWRCGVPPKRINYPQQTMRIAFINQLNTRLMELGWRGTPVSAEPR